MEPYQYFTFLIPIAVIGGYYFWYLRKVKNAGGYAAMFARAQTARFGLGPNETANPLTAWRGQYYIGPLIPGTERSGWQKFGDALTDTSYRGRGIELTITSLNRLVISGEPMPDSDVKYDAASGDSGYRPIESFPATQRPTLMLADQAFGADPNLAKARKEPPSGYNPQGQMVKWELVVMKLPAGGTMVVWLDPGAVIRLQQWCATGT